MIRSTCAILLVGFLTFVCDAQEARQSGEGQSFALVIGVGEHRDRGVPSLAYAAGDAVAIGERLGSYGYAVTTLVDRAATREAIFRGASALRERVRPRDRVVIYFAGHALQSAWAKEPFLVAHDTERAYPEARGIRLVELMDLFRGIEGIRLLYMLDHSFLAVDSKTGAFDPKMAYYFYDDLRYNWLERNPVNQAMVVLATLSAQRPVSPDQRRGAFAAAVLEALGSTVADGNRDGRLSIAEFVSFTRFEARSLASQSGAPAIDIGEYMVGYVEDFMVADFGAAPAASPSRVAELEFARKQRDLHLQTLQRLSDVKAISVRTRLFTQALLDRWVESLETNDPLTEEQSLSLEDVLYILGSRYADREKAEMLEGFQNYVQQPLQAPGNLAVK